jgi:hypothetical protein
MRDLHGAACVRCPTPGARAGAVVGRCSANARAAQGRSDGSNSAPQRRTPDFPERSSISPRSVPKNADCTELKPWTRPSRHSRYRTPLQVQVHVQMQVQLRLRNFSTGNAAHLDCFGSGFKGYTISD